MPHPKVKISDDSGNTVAVDTSGASNALKVALVDSASIDIGDVSILAGDGTAITNTVSGRLDVTLDSNSGVFAEDVAHSDGDKGIHILAIKDTLMTPAIPPAGLDGDYLSLRTDKGGALWARLSTTNAAGSLSKPIGHSEDDAYSGGDGGIMALSVRSNTAASTSGADGDYQPLITDTNGRLHVIDVSTAAALSGSEIQVDVVAALPVGNNPIGKVGHNITGILSDDNPTVGTSAEAITTDGVDGAASCKRMDIMAHPSNTGEIWVGDAAITTNGLNGGIRLLPGDVYSIDIDNTGDIYVIATVDGENVSYNYFT